MFGKLTYASATVEFGFLAPETSPSWGKLVAETLSKSFYVEVPRTGHGTTQRACGRSLVQSFLAHPETQRDTACFAGLRAKGFYKQDNNRRVHPATRPARPADWPVRFANRAEHLASRPAHLANRLNTRVLSSSSTPIAASAFKPTLGGPIVPSGGPRQPSK